MKMRRLKEWYLFVYICMLYIICKRKPERKWKSGKKRRFVTLVFFFVVCAFASFQYSVFSILYCMYSLERFSFQKLLEQMQNTFFFVHSFTFFSKMENICCKRKINFIFMRNKHKEKKKKIFPVIFVDFWCL